MLLVNALLVCVLCGAGFSTLTRWRTTAKKLWLVKTESPPSTVRVPLFTRVYIVRCWQEHTRRDDEIVVRYALDIPATGQRCGYTSAEALLDTLSMELTGTQETPPMASERPSRQPSRGESELSSGEAVWGRCTLSIVTRKHGCVMSAALLISHLKGGETHAGEEQSKSRHDRPLGRNLMPAWDGV